MVKHSQQLTVVGLGDPVMDVLFQVDHEFLATVAEKAGGCTNISSDELERLTKLAGVCEPVRWAHAACSWQAPDASCSCHHM